MDYRFQIARRYLVSRKEFTLISVITGISVAGVTLGVAALIVVLSVMNGFYDFVRDLMVSIDPHVRIVSAEGRSVAGADSLLELARGLPHVASAAPYVEGKALLLHESAGSDVNKVVVVRGVEPSTLRGVSQVVDQTGFGSFDLAARDGRPGVVLGMSLGQRFGLLPEAGSREASHVGLLSAPAIERLFTQLLGSPPIQRFEVRGLYELQSVYDESHIFVGLEQAQRLFRMPDGVTGVELRLDDLQRASEVKTQLQQQLDPDRYEVKTWYDLQQSLYDVMRLEKWGASIILILIVVVAAFNIVGSLTMVVIEKRSDVGVLQAMGVSRRSIRRIFLTEGLLIGGVGTSLGVLLGLGLALAQQHFALVPLAGAESFLIDAYPVAIRTLDVALVATVSMVLCVLASLYPAARAAAIEPARAVQMDG